MYYKIKNFFQKAKKHNDINPLKANNIHIDCVKLKIIKN